MLKICPFYVFTVQTCRSAGATAERCFFSSLPSSEYLSGASGIWGLSLVLHTFSPVLSLVLYFACVCGVRREKPFREKLQCSYPKGLMATCTSGPSHTLAVLCSCSTGGFGLCSEEERRAWVPGTWSLLKTQLNLADSRIAFTLHVVPMQLLGAGGAWQTRFGN